MSRMISYSEAADFMTCELLHYFKYRKRLRSTKKSATDWGTLFHAGLEAYYKAMQAGGDKTDCFKAADKAFAEAIKKDDSLEMFAPLVLIRMKEYADHYWAEDRGWEILEVEKVFKLPEHNFCFTADLIVRELTGQHAGQLLLVDFKTGRDFWTDRQFETDAQHPRYLWGLQQFDEYKSIRRFMIGQIRTRELKTPLPRDIFRRNKYTPSKTKIQNHRNYQDRISRRIWKFDKLNEKEHLAAVLPTHSYSACTYCKFSTLCDLVTNGQSTELAEQIGFEVSDYGDQYL